MVDFKGRRFHVKQYEESECFTASDKKGMILWVSESTAKELLWKLAK